jgi:hypothetical protein
MHSQPCDQIIELTATPRVLRFLMSKASSVFQFGYGVGSHGRSCFR